jgi:hypothetical protein
LCGANGDSWRFQHGNGEWDVGEKTGIVGMQFFKRNKCGNDAGQISAICFHCTDSWAITCARW